jgi:hypothetical protein
MPGQKQKRAVQAVVRAVGFGVAGRTARQLGAKSGTNHRHALSKLGPLPGDIELGQEGRRVLLCLALDEHEDSRVRVVAARELVALGVAEEDRRRLAQSNGLDALMATSDEELEKLANCGQ